MDDLFDIAALNALQTLKGIDKEFLLSQREKGRVGCLIGIDEAGEQLDARRLKRADKEENRKRKHAIESKQQFATGQISDDESESPAESVSEDYVPKSRAPNGKY